MKGSVLMADYAENPRTNWVQGISRQDMDRLRKAVRKIHLHYLPESLFSDKQADMLIEALGPHTAEKLIKRAVDEGFA
jgi:hypothetical protein